MTRRILIALVGLGSLLFAACGGSSDEVSVDTEAVTDAGFLSAAVDRTTDEGFNYSMSLDLHMSIPGTPGIDATDIAFGEGQVDGNLARFVMDMNAMLGAMGAPAGALGSGDLSMETITDADAGVTYLRAPMFALLGNQPGSPLAGLAELGDDWGKVDLNALGDAVPSELMTQLSGGGMGFDAMLELVRNAENSREVGTQEIGGTTATGVSADLTFDELLSTSGMDLDSLTGLMGGGAPAETEQVLDAMSGLTMPITVWVDDEARIVRIEMDMDLSPMFVRMAEQLGQPSMGDLEMRFGYVIDTRDFGSPDAITVPTDTVDITEQYRELLSSLSAN